MARLFLTALVLLLAACSETVRTPGPARPSGVVVVREFGWLANVSEPQARWHPTGTRVVARAPGGIALYTEGRNAPKLYGYHDGRQPWDPQWLDDQKVVIGPQPVVTTDAAGHVVLPRDGISVTALGDRGLGEPLVLSTFGYRPRPWGERGIVVSSGNEIWLIRSDGRNRLIEEGFEPEPQPDGPGLAWRDKPFPGTDHWSGSTGKGSYLVRWKPGTVDRIPDAVQVAWTPWGGVLATILDGEPPANAAWTTGKVRIVHLAGPGKAPVTVMEGGHSPAPHPTEGLFAANDVQGRLYLVGLDGSGERLLKEDGRLPTWSADGTRLLVEERTDDPRVRYLAVRVVALRR